MKYWVLLCLLLFGCDNAAPQRIDAPAERFTPQESENVTEILDEFIRKYYLYAKRTWDIPQSETPEFYLKNILNSHRYEKETAWFKAETRLKRMLILGSSPIESFNNVKRIPMPTFCPDYRGLIPLFSDTQQTLRIEEFDAVTTRYSELKEILVKISNIIKDEDK